MAQGSAHTRCFKQEGATVNFGTHRGSLLGGFSLPLRSFLWLLRFLVLLRQVFCILLRPVALDALLLSKEQLVSVLSSQDLNAPKCSPRKKRLKHIMYFGTLFVYKQTDKNMAALPKWEIAAMKKLQVNGSRKGPSKDLNLEYSCPKIGVDIE